MVSGPSSLVVPLHYTSIIVFLLILSIDVSEAFGSFLAGIGAKKSRAAGGGGAAVEGNWQGK